MVSRQGGQLTKAKDTIMCTFGSSWKEASVNGKVVSIIKNTWRVEWSIGAWCRNHMHWIMGNPFGSRRKHLYLVMALMRDALQLPKTLVMRL